MNDLSTQRQLESAATDPATVDGAAGLDERAPAVVLDDELVAKDFVDPAFDRDPAPVMHRRDRRRGQHHQGRLSTMQGDGGDRAAGRKSADHGCGGHHAPPEGPDRREARSGDRVGGTLWAGHGTDLHLLSIFRVYLVPPQCRLNLAVQIQLSFSI